MAEYDHWDCGLNRQGEAAPKDGQQVLGPFRVIGVGSCKHIWRHTQSVDIVLRECSLGLYAMPYRFMATKLLQAPLRFVLGCNHLQPTGSEGNGRKRMVLLTLNLGVQFTFSSLMTLLHMRVGAARG